jgi:hypothetical protein
MSFIGEPDPTSPGHALAWRISLRRGDVVLSGALGSMVPAKPGTALEARFQGLGSVRVTFGKHPSRQASIERRYRPMKLLRCGTPGQERPDLLDEGAHP